MARRGIRVILLHEDRLQERFFRKALKGLGLESRDVRSVPKSHFPGSGKQWVKEQFLHQVQALRSRNYQKNLALITVIDGDEDGHTQRKKQLTQGCPREADESIVIEIPTWSIETWLGLLNGEGDLVETTKYKYSRWMPNRDEHNRRTEYIQHAVRRFLELRAQPNNSSGLMSLDDGLRELNRLPDGS